MRGVSLGPLCVYVCVCVCETSVCVCVILTTAQDLGMVSMIPGSWSDVRCSLCSLPILTWCTVRCGRASGSPHACLRHCMHRFCCNLIALTIGNQILRAIREFPVWKETEAKSWDVCMGVAVR